MAHSPPTDLNRRLFRALYRHEVRRTVRSNHVGINSPVARQHLTFPLLSDADLTVHRLYGAYGEKKLYGKVYEGVIRSTFVIDGDGVIRVARIHPRYSNHERFLGILVQAGSHGGAHRAAKAAELVLLRRFRQGCPARRQRQNIITSMCIVLISLMHGRFADLYGGISAMPQVIAQPLSNHDCGQENAHLAAITNLHIEKTRRMIRAVIRNRNIILFLSCNNNHCYVAEAYDYRPSKRFPESLPSC